jgi:methyl-accepting chemotaxis protein
MEPTMADPQYEMGRLAQAVETLTAQMTKLEQSVEEMSAQMNRGKGFAIGMLLASASGGAAIATAIGKLFGK